MTNETLPPLSHQDFKELTRVIRETVRSESKADREALVEALKAEFGNQRQAVVDGRKLSSGSVDAELNAEDRRARELSKEMDKLA